MKKSSLILFLSWLWLAPAFAEEPEPGLYIMDSVDPDETTEREILDFEEESRNVFVPETIEDEDLRKPDKTQSSSIPDIAPEFEVEKLDPKKLQSQRMQLVPSGAIPEGGEFLEFESQQTLQEANKLRAAYFAIHMMRDTFNYNSNEGYFNETYRRKGNGRMSDFPGIIRLSNVHFLHTGLVDFGVGGALGVGYNGGRGVFLENGAQSDAKFKLWTIPLDIVFVAELPVTRFVKLSAQGGPSALGLIQNRSDKPEDSRDRTMRQVSVGYFLGAAFKLSLGDIFTSTGEKLFSDMQVSKLYLNLEARTQKYENFKSNDLSVGGESFGIGFTFEYL